MPQQTNLNVSPYFDDFNANNDYHRVLFKPEYPIQSRELTTLQSILQNQIEKFGQHFFKEGTKVIPGNTTYNNLHYAVELQNTYQGVPVSGYINQIIGAKITGRTSGVTAIVDKVLLPQNSERNSLTLYVNYLASDARNNSTQGFSDSEELFTDITISSGLLGNPIITSGSSFAITKINNSTSTGSSFSISEGVYFIRGQFINVKSETLILDQYSNSPSYRVGLFVLEEIVTSDMDETLTDNSQGFNNYAAPGADRLKISTSLYKKSLNDFNDNNFIELATIQDGILRTQKNATDNNIINDLLAQRTYSESGDYYIKPFDVTIKESLNDNVGNRGIFNSGQFTYGGSTPSDSLGVYQISPGRAFVRGYNVENISTTFLDFQKPRTTNTLNQQAINYNTGSTIKVNRVFGTPQIGIGNTYILSLRDSRVNSNQYSASGKEIGVARVYDFRLDSGTYNTSNSNLNQWNLSLFDIQTTSEITLNVPVTLSIPTVIKGKYSGAIAFLKDNVSNSGLVTVYNKTGEFVQNESFIINGIDDGKVALAVTSYGISNIKSVYGYIGSGTTFTADIIQSNEFSVGVATISPYSGGISTISSPNTQFPGKNIVIGDIIQYSGIYSDPVYARVVGVGAETITVTQVPTVSGITSSILPTTSFNATDLQVLTTKLDFSSDNTLYTKLPKNNISYVDLSTSSLTIRKAFQVNISNNQLSSPISAGTNELFLPFTENRYSLIRSDGITIALTGDKFSYLNGSSQLQIYNLGSNDTGATLVATLTKLSPQNKVKLKNRVNSIVVNKSNNSASGIGSTTLNDGLLYGTYPYGTRVQDDIISLNSPDVIEIHGIYESLSATSSPSAPTLTLASISGPSNTTADLIVGEKIIGQTSGAVSICAELLSGNQISFIYKNQNLLREGETVLFEESKISAIITNINSSSLDISTNYIFDNGQESTIYNYGKVYRKTNSLAPSKPIKIYFKSAYYSTADDKDITNVNSYNTFDYVKEIQSINDTRNTDIIDIRPRVSAFNVAQNSRSPLEFYGRTFNQSGNTASNILASDESIIVSFSYYLGRIDKIFINKDGVFQIRYGTPAESPEAPVAIDDALEIATITLPPYLYNISQASIRFLDHKGYRMSDIKKLEDRIKNLEYYTALSLLESSTANLSITDVNGLSRYKSGFFVDNFTSSLSQEDQIKIKNSIDVSNSILRPEHYTTSLDLITGPIVNNDPNVDFLYNEPEGINIKQSNNILTLDYSETEWLKQSFATRTENITPFMINFWKASLTLTPSSDNWVDVVSVEIPRIVDSIGEYQISRSVIDFDSQSGFSSNIWNLFSSAREKTSTNSSYISNSNTTQQVNYSTIQSSSNSRNRQSILADGTSQFESRSSSRNLITYIRTRNIQFSAKNIKPLTRVYSFFDGIDVTKYCVPKLIEIVMSSGVFSVGETVNGYIQNSGLNQVTGQELSKISFRVAASNHFEGRYNSPSKTYSNNPYTGQILQSSYSSTSNTLNVDTFSLSNQPQGQFGGWIQKDMILVGQTSGAQAIITDVRLISDVYGNLIGSLFIPDPNTDINPKFTTGTKTFKLTSSSLNDDTSSTTICNADFISNINQPVVQEEIISIRNSSQVEGLIDPLAESFFVDESTGVFLTHCDIFFSSVDTMGIPVTLQIRTMSNGVPTQQVVPLSEVVLNPNEIQVSNDGSIATSFMFSAPVYLEGGKQYAICLSSNSTKYNVFVSRIGENDLITKSLISNQSFLGVFFKSQNGSTWEPSQLEDLKFTLYRADFVNSGTVEFYNPDLSEGNGQVAKLVPDSLQFNSRKIRVSLGSTIQDTELKLGNTILQINSNGTGNYVGSAGIATGTLSIVNTGIGYTPSSGSYTFNNVQLITLTGSGRNATANVTVSNGSIVSTGVTIVSGGTGYQVGDVISISNLGTLATGQNAKFTINNISSINELILDNVQGDFVTGAGSTIQYVNSSGITTTLNSSFGGNVIVNSPIVVINDGLHLKVNHKNHGMHSLRNYVALSNAQTDVKPTKLSASYNANSTSAISVDDITNFTTFEGLLVSPTNPGYVLIGNEVISYTAISGSSLAGTITRGSNAINYSIGVPVYKYELNGVSLRRINTTHDFNIVSINDAITLDSYYVKLDMSQNGTNRASGILSKLYSNITKSAGGYNITATQNIPYEIITPNIHNLTVSGTYIETELRSVTGNSISGNETPFIDNGYEMIAPNQINYLNSPRIVCSKVNETNNLSLLKGNKSMNLRVNLETNNSKVSPVIDIGRSSVIFTSNRVNDVISNYSTDNRVNSIVDDPTAFTYITKEIELENPATSLKIFLNAYINRYSDIRVFYATSPSPNFTPTFIPFPGYKNIDQNNQVINFADSDGSSDFIVSSSSYLGFDYPGKEFKEYVFTADYLPSFRSFRIKILMSSTSQVFVPKLKDYLRVIALA